MDIPSWPGFWLLNLSWMIVVYLDSFQTCQFFSSWNLQPIRYFTVWNSTVGWIPWWVVKVGTWWSHLIFLEWTFFILPPIIMEVKHGSQPMASFPFIWGSLENFHDCGRKGESFLTFFVISTKPILLESFVEDKNSRNTQTQTLWRIT